MECLFCSRKFQNKHKLEIHYRKYTRERPYICQKCPIGLNSKHSLNHHLETHRPRAEREKTECQFCGNLFLAKDKLKLHIRHHHEEMGRFECKLCGKKLANPGNLKRHEALHTNRKTFACTICPKAFKSEEILKVHKKGVHGTRQYECTKCEKTFTLKYSLHLHIKTHAPHRERFQCDKCPKSFLRKLLYEEHRLIHQDQQFSFQCDKCVQSFFTFRGLKCHKSQIHLEKRSIMECVFCKKQVPDASRLELHLCRHVLERPQFCKFCPAEFTTLAKLRGHNKKTHEKMRMHFKFEMCQKSFASETYLNDHIRQHLGEVHYECQSSGCGMQFATYDARRFHFLKAHVGKQFLCKLCGKKFYTKTDLRRHSVIHANVKDYHCGQCSSSFKRKYNLEKHDKTVHSV